MPDPIAGPTELRQDSEAEAEALRNELRKARGRLEKLERRYARLAEKFRTADTRRSAYRRAFRTIEAAAFGPQTDPQVEGPTMEQLSEMRAVLDEQRAEAHLAHAIRSGSDFDLASIETVRALIASGMHVPARTLAHSLTRSPLTAPAGEAGSALIAMHQKLYQEAWQRIRPLPRDVWTRLLPAEYIELALRFDPERGVRECEALLEGSLGTDVDDPSLLEVARSAFASGKTALAGRVVGLLTERSGGDPDLGEDGHAELSWLSGWIDREQASAPASPVSAPTLALLDYKQPDLRQTSTNVGDYVQTLAAVSQLVRRPGIRFEGDEELCEYLGELQARLAGAPAPAGEAASIRLEVVDRDFSSGAAVGDGTWLLAFGWFLHRVFDVRYDFPFDPRLRPIFISVHISRRELLTEDAIAYLRRYAPIGCRDWSTVFLLHGVGVPAFFSGCLTTTIGALYPAGDPASAGERPFTLVDFKDPEGEFPGSVVSRTQVDPEVRHRSLASNLRAAEEMLARYRDETGAIATSRLHCYLPATALGIDVAFRPKHMGDPRFDGLLGLGPDSEALATIRSGIEDKVGRVLEAIIGGEEEERVYEIWREACAEDVAAAQAAINAPLPELRPHFDVGAACAAIHEARTEIGPTLPPGGTTVHVAMSLDAGFLGPLPVVIESLLANTDRPLHLWITTRGPVADELARIASLFPEISFTLLPCDQVDHGEIRGMLRHITIPVMDRLLLPELLTDVDRCVFLDLDLLAVADVGELFDTDLGDAPVAARVSTLPGNNSGFHHVYKAASRLDAATASELRRRMHLRWDFDYPSFNAGVMVLDLAQMRDEDFCNETIPFAGRYGMNDQEAMACYVGPRLCRLPVDWNYWPKQDVADAPKLIHWAGPIKPWHAYYTRDAEVWDEFSARWESRQAGRSGAT